MNGAERFEEEILRRETSRAFANGTSVNLRWCWHGRSARRFSKRTSAFSCGASSELLASRTRAAGSWRIREARRLLAEWKTEQETADPTGCHPAQPGRDRSARLPSTLCRISPTFNFNPEGCPVHWQSDRLHHL
jgi:hypothetical protein